MEKQLNSSYGEIVFLKQYLHCLAYFPKKISDCVIPCIIHYFISIILVFFSKLVSFFS